jgi:hypothetical protein
VCDLRATAIAAGSCYGARITGPTASTYDDGARGVRRQTVLAEDFRMVSAARQRGALRIPNTAFLITFTMQAATSGVRRRGVGAAAYCVLALGTTPVGFRCRASLGPGFVFLCTPGLLRLGAGYLSFQGRATSPPSAL